MLGGCPPFQLMKIGGRSPGQCPPAGVADIVDSVVLSTIAGATLPTDVAK